MFLAEALGDLGAALGFSALALEVARTGEAFWVGLLAVMGYLTLGPVLFLGPWIDRARPARALRGWLLPKEGQAASLAALRVLLYGAGALGGGLAGVLGRADPALPLRLGLLGFLAFLLFLPGPLHPRRLGVLARHREGGPEGEA